MFTPTMFSRRRKENRNPLCAKEVKRKRTANVNGRNKMFTQKENRKFIRLYTCIYLYIYIYMYREREIESERSTYINMYIYIYILREREIYIHVYIYIYICVYTYMINDMSAGT